MASATWLRQAAGHSARRANRSTRSRRAAVALAGARVVFQPIVSLATGSMLGVEALTRFARADGAGPAETIAEAHVAGYGSELEALCVRTALARREHLPPGTRIAVNLSPTGLRQIVTAPFWPADLHGVVVELTEQDIDNPGATARALEVMRERGAEIAVDDMGSGYSGVLRVADLQPDFVKLDKALVSAVADDRTGARTAALESLVTLSHRLGAEVIAEGLADLAALPALAALDVDYVQGFAIGHPAFPPQPVADDVVLACRSARQRVLDGAGTGAAAARTRDVYAITAALQAGDGVSVCAAIAIAAADLRVDAASVSALVGPDALREIAVAGRRIDERTYRLDDYPATVASLSSGHMLEAHLDDATGDAAEQELLRLFGDASLLLVPVLSAGTPLGVIELIQRKPRRWSSSDIAYAQGLAAHLAPVLARAVAVSAPGPH